MDIIRDIDLVIHDCSVSPDAVRYIPEPDPDPDYCLDCGHYHSGGCPDPDAPCGDRRCCIN